jgi:hypothetical protein
MPIETQRDVEVACDRAGEMLCNDWAENLRRCVDGR